MNETELGLLITQKDPYTGKTKPKKRTFSFLSKIKVKSRLARIQRSTDFKINSMFGMLN